MRLRVRKGVSAMYQLDRLLCVLGVVSVVMAMLAALGVIKLLEWIF